MSRNGHKLPAVISGFSLHTNTSSIHNELVHPQGPFHDGQSFREAYKRFRFGIKKSSYLDLVHQIERDNSSLAKLAEQSAALEAGRLTRKKIPNFQRIRVYAISIFGALHAGLHRTCQASHKASLVLSSIQENENQGNLGFRKSGEGDGLVVRVVLHHGLPASNPNMIPWTMEEAEFRLLDSSTAIVTANQPATPMSATANQTTIPSVP